VGPVQARQLRRRHQDLTRATSLAPNEAEVHYHLARAFQKKERYTEAGAELQRSLRLDPQLEPAATRTPEIQPLLPPTPKADKKDHDLPGTSSHPKDFPNNETIGT